MNHRSKKHRFSYDKFQTRIKLRHKKAGARERDITETKALIPIVELSKQMMVETSRMMIVEMSLVIRIKRKRVDSIKKLKRKRVESK